MAWFWLRFEIFEPAALLGTPNVFQCRHLVVVVHKIHHGDVRADAAVYTAVGHVAVGLLQLTHLLLLRLLQQRRNALLRIETKRRFKRSY